MKTKENILITGSSSGIGEAVARLYLEQGFDVGLCGRDQARLRKACEGYPGAHPLSFDIADKEAVSAAFSEFVKVHGRVDRIILNAGTHAPTDGASFSLQDYTRTMQINYIGTLNCLAPAIEILRAQGHGQLVLMGSVAGYKGLPGAGGYCASKSAIMRLAETLRVELRDLGIDVRLISPGFVKTPLTDLNEFSMPFLMQVDKAAERIVRGLRSRRFEIAFPRRFAWLLKLNAVLPAPVYFWLARKMLRDDRPI